MLADLGMCAPSPAATMPGSHLAAGKCVLPLSERSSLNGVNVLIVEDSWHVASAIKSVVENAGMDVVALAATVADAERTLLRHAPQVAVVDINLHGEETYGFIERLFAQQIPVIIISGYEVLPAFTERANAILKKPIRASVLLSTLQRIASERGEG